MTSVAHGELIRASAWRAAVQRPAPPGGKVAFIGANNPETARMVRDVQVATGVEFIGYFDNDPDKKGRTFCGLPVFGGFDDLLGCDRTAFGLVNLITRDTKTRHETTRFFAENGFAAADFIHPSINLDGVTLGRGVYLQEGVIVQGGVVLGDNVCVNSGATISHETSLGTSCFVAPGATLAGLVTLEPGVLIGAGASVMPRLSLGTGTTVGAGAVITKDTTERSIMVGVPAVETGKTPDDEAFLPLFLDKM
ncbi:LbetaH domain-containing protein [Pacificitalea manganoxidans]|nr:transferase [Pacificitalea manganoxidans]MDR6310398.1 sugar O-acyltransferase (sialic acid O-acetyltransferase NeuD family) [Pacificitalea manganoxidans]